MILNKKIIIQKLELDTEKWSDYFTAHAEINIASGKEYFNASTNITSSTYNFKIRYCSELKELQYDTSSYRIVYDNHIFNIKNVDNYMLKNQLLTIVGEFNVK